MKKTRLILFLLLISAYGSAQTTPPDSARFFEGSLKTVCGKIASMTVKETIIYLNFDQPYPNQQFTAVIFKQDFSKLDSVITELRVLKDICVTGKIEMYKEKAQVIIKSADQVNPK